MCLAGAVQDVADEPTGELAVDTLGDGAECTGEAQMVGDGLRQLHRSRGDEPYLLAGVEMALRQSPCARPDLVGDVLVVDLLAESGELGRLATRDERQRLFATLRDVLGVLLARDAELGLRPREVEDVGVREVLARSESACKVHDRRSLDQGVVDVEECRGGEVDGDVGLAR